MALIMPPGDNLRNAVVWITEELNSTERDRIKVVNEAIFRFDLNPLQSDFIMNLYITSCFENKQCK